MLAAPRVLTPVLPGVLLADGAAWLTLPPSLDYPL